MCLQTGDYSLHPNKKLKRESKDSEEGCVYAQVFLTNISTLPTGTRPKMWAYNKVCIWHAGASLQQNEPIIAMRPFYNDSACNRRYKHWRCDKPSPKISRDKVKDAVCPKAKRKTSACTASSLPVNVKSSSTVWHSCLLLLLNQELWDDGSKMSEYIFTMAAYQRKARSRERILQTAPFRHAPLRSLHSNL